MDTKKIHSKKNIIIFDVDSSSIAGGIFEFNFDVKQECLGARELFTMRKDIINTSHNNFDEFWKRTKNKFTEVAEEVHLQSMIEIDEIYCNVSAPWSSSQKREISYAKKKEFVFTQELADELIEKELGSPLSKNLDYHKHHVELIDRKTIAVYGNGYPTRNPIDKKMNEVKIDSLVTVMSEDTKKEFEHIIEKAFHRIPEFTSNIFMSYYDAQKSLPQHNDAITIDVSGELTEVIIMTNDHLKILGTLPIGVNSIIRKVANELGENFSKAKKHVELLQLGSLDSGYAAKVQVALGNAYQLWLREFYNFCDSASKQGLLPNTIIMKTYAGVMNWFETLLLSSDELSEHMHARAQINVVHLHTERIKEKIDLQISDPELRVVAHALATRIN